MKTLLNKRLNTISAFINSCDKVIDIGCDHGLLGIAMVLEKNISRMVSSDINQGPLAKARENIQKYHLEDKIELRLGDGLDCVDEDIDTIVISGMGGITITNILRDIKKYPHIQKIIISPNNDFPLTRKGMMKLGWMIKEEQMIYEKEKYYLVSCYIRGSKKNSVFFGKLNLNDKVVKEYYLSLYNTNKIILSKLSIKNKRKKNNLIKENLLIKLRIKHKKIVNCKTYN